MAKANTRRAILNVSDALGIHFANLIKQNRKHVLQVARSLQDLFETYPAAPDGRYRVSWLVGHHWNCHRIETKQLHQSRGPQPPSLSVLQHTLNIKLIIIYITNFWHWSFPLSVPLSRQSFCSLITFIYEYTFERLFPRFLKPSLSTHSPTVIIIVSTSILNRSLNSVSDASWRLNASIRWR